MTSITTAKDLVNWEAKFRTLTVLKEAGSKSKKRQTVEQADQFGAEMDTMTQAEEEEKENFLKKSGGYVKSLVARDVTELAAISTLVLFGATILDKLVIQRLPKRRPRRRARA